MLRISTNLVKGLPKIESVAYLHIASKHGLRSSPLGNKHLNSYRRHAFFREIQRRHESSTSQASQWSAEPPMDPIPDPPEPVSAVTQSVVEMISGEPSFASMGLGSWWPPGLIQKSLEFLHITCDLPWWGCVVCGTIVIRMCLFPITLMSQRHAAKLNNNMPKIQGLQLKVTEANQRGDKFLAAKYSGELMKFMSDKGINPMKGLIPPLCQSPVFISVFMALRGMASYPVESLKTGGLFWFSDLTVPDQFYLLPIFTSATLFCTIKLGAEGMQPSENMVIVRYVLMGLPVILLPMTVNFPGLLLWYWTTTNFITLLQVGFLRIPKVRDFFNIEQLIKHPPAAKPLSNKGFVTNVKDAWTNIKITSQLQDRERADRLAFSRAGRDPVKKTYKYDPTKVKPSMAAIQAKKSS